MDFEYQTAYPRRTLVERRAEQGENKTRRLAILSFLTAAALVLSIVDTALSSIIFAALPLPGARLGLANIITVYLLCIADWQDALFVAIARIFITAVLFGGPVMLIYSLVGAMFSLAAMLFLKKTKIFSIIAVSAAGGFFFITSGSSSSPALLLAA